MQLSADDGQAGRVERVDQGCSGRCAGDGADTGSGGHYATVRLNQSASVLQGQPRDRTVVDRGDGGEDDGSELRGVGRIQGVADGGHCCPGDTGFTVASNTGGKLVAGGGGGASAQSDC